MPVGDTRPQRVDVRVVAATNADLEQRVADGKFREDLFYRLSVIRLYVPPLRDRREEIPHLSTFFLREASERLGKPGVRLSLKRSTSSMASRGLATSVSCATRCSGPSPWRFPAASSRPDLLSPVFASMAEKPGDGSSQGFFAGAPILPRPSSPSSAR